MDSTEPQSSLSSKRSSAISTAEVHSILTQGTNPAAQPSPIEHIQRSRPSSSGGVAASQQSGQALPTASIPTSQPTSRSNRFSLTFPVLPPSKEVSPTRRSISPSRDTVLSPTELVNVPADPGDGNFLTAIAAQERRVLEIKEELQRAESELGRLKLLWANHEAQKKKSETRRVTKLRPLSVTLPSPSTLCDASDSQSPWLQHQEMERRRALMAGPRTSRGTVFSGSRHTRTLSLLTPMQRTAPVPVASPSRPRRDTSPDKSADAVPAEVRSGPLARSSTTPELSAEAAGKNDVKLDLSELGIDKDLVLNTGKKMALGLKDGLWTFWEDLRQATVGEEIVQVVPPQQLRSPSSTQTLRSHRRGGSKSSLRASSRSSTSSKKSTDTKRASAQSPVDKRSSPKRSEQLPLPPLVDVADTPVLATEVVTSPKRTPTTSKRSAKHIKTPSEAVSTASSDGWDGWDDSPKFSRSSSATSETTSHHSPAQETESTPSKAQRNSEASASNDPLPWPALGKLGGATLRRTASHLMSEWDKLSPPPKKVDDQTKSYFDTDSATRLQKQESMKQD